MPIRNTKSDGAKEVWKESHHLGRQIIFGCLHSGEKDRNSFLVVAQNRPFHDVLRVVTRCSHDQHKWRVLLVPFVYALTSVNFSAHFVF